MLLSVGRQLFSVQSVFFPGALLLTADRFRLSGDLPDEEWRIFKSEKESPFTQNFHKNLAFFSCKKTLIMVK